MMEVKRRKPAPRRQQYGKPGVDVGIVAAKHAADRFALQHFTPGIAHRETMRPKIWEEIKYPQSLQQLEIGNVPQLTAQLRPFFQNLAKLALW